MNFLAYINIYYTAGGSLWSNYSQTAYLENDINTFIMSTKCKIISIHYTTLIYDDELTHNVLLYYIIPTE